MGNHHGDGLAKHSGFGFNTADSPPQDAEAIDHGGMRIGADKRVGIGRAMAIRLMNKNYASEIFEIDLVDDAGIGRHDCQVAKRGLAPA